MKTSEMRNEINKILEVHGAKTLNDTDSNTIATRVDVDAIDSLQFISIIVDLEAKFEIRIPDELLNTSTIETVEKIVSIVQELEKDKHE